MNTIEIIEGTGKTEHRMAHEVFEKIKENYKYKFIFESKDVSPIYGRLSLIGVDPILQICGKNSQFQVKILEKRGRNFFTRITEEKLAIFCDSFEINEDSITGQVTAPDKNISEIIRLFLKEFHINQKTLLGLYGGFSYDFARLFEDLDKTLPDNNVDDFNLFLYDTFIFFDHLKEKTEIVVFRETDQETQKAIKTIQEEIKNPTETESTYEIQNPQFELEEKTYEDLVKTAQEYCKKGEIFEVVFSNILKADFKGNPYALYLRYRETNPSPYLFFFDFGTDQLVGASPEMMVRCENNLVQLRPISGTAKRGKDPIEDHENMLNLLSNEKERSELDMLIDLGRNDLSRVCKAGIKISDYRFVEKYSEVMHTVAHLTGELEEGKTALDALIATINAGTLTGAPKIAAMNIIEKHEQERRGYYGGTIGYLTFSGDMDTGIIIRTAHIRDQKLRFQVGATLLYDSIPTAEYQETINKAQAFLNTFA